MDQIQEAEMLFAQKLAGNEKKYRDKALKKLRTYLYTKSSFKHGGFTEVDFLKIWKGLHYCMWMQDKPLLHEELSESICGLVQAFKNPDAAVGFIKAYYITECREWNSIDKWRMDKFLMMFRGMWRQTLIFLKSNKWNDRLVKEMLDFISLYILHDHSHQNSPDGVRFHMVDIFLAELMDVAGKELGPKQTVIFLKPWIDMLPGLTCQSLRTQVIKEIFGEIIMQSDIMSSKRKSGKAKLRVNYNLLADRLFDVGSKDTCLTFNRAAIYDLVQKFRALANGKLPYEPEPEEEPVKDLSEVDVEQAVERIQELEKKMRDDLTQEKVAARLAKRKQESRVEDEAYGSASDEDVVSKKLKVTGSGDTKTRKGGVKKSKDKPKAQKEKPQILSKKLKNVLQAELEYMEESDLDDETINGVEEDIDADDGAGDQMMSKAKTTQIAKGRNVKARSMSEGISNEHSEPVIKPSVPSTANTRVSPVATRARRKALASCPENGSSYVKEKLEPLPQATEVAAGNSSTVQEFDEAEFSDHEELAESSSVKIVSNSSTVMKPSTLKASQSTSSTNGTSMSGAESHVSQAENTHFSNTPKQVTSLNRSVNKRRNGSLKKGTLGNMQAEEKAAEKTKTTTDKGQSKFTKKSLKSTATADAQDTPEGSKMLAHFVSPKGAAAKYLRKSSSKQDRATPTKQAQAKLVDEGEGSQKKRISFGSSSAVKKTSVRITELSYDPLKTPEQGILKVNPIKPGTVIAVGKQATIKNTMKNSKYPSRMLASELF